MPQKIPASFRARLAAVLIKHGLNPDSVTPRKLHQWAERIGLTSAQVAVYLRIFCPEPAQEKNVAPHLHQASEDFDPRKPWRFSEFEKRLLEAFRRQFPGEKRGNLSCA